MDILSYLPTNRQWLGLRSWARCQHVSRNCSWNKVAYVLPAQPRRLLRINLLKNSKYALTNQHKFQPHQVQRPKASHAEPSARWGKPSLEIQTKPGRPRLEVSFNLLSKHGFRAIFCFFFCFIFHR